MSHQISSIQINVNPRIFPLPIVQKTLYYLSNRIDGRVEMEDTGQFIVTLTALATDLTPTAMERELNAKLIETSVNEQAFQVAAPIRNYLAQTAFSITTENQQTVEEFAASMGREWLQEQHAGAPISHRDHWHGPGPEEEEDSAFESTESGNRRMVDEERGRVMLYINTRKYLLPDVLWAAYEVRETCACLINSTPHNQLTVTLTPTQSDTDLDTLIERFEHWLNVALARD